jgi:hypothetical protein
MAEVNQNPAHYQCGILRSSSQLYSASGSGLAGCSAWQKSQLIQLSMAIKYIYREYYSLHYFYPQ